MPSRVAPVTLASEATFVSAGTGFGAALTLLLHTKLGSGSDKERQDFAESGKTLPDEQDEADPLLAWLAAPLLPAEQLPPPGLSLSAGAGIAKGETAAGLAIPTIANNADAPATTASRDVLGTGSDLPVPDGTGNVGDAPLVREPVGDRIATADAPQRRATGPTAPPPVPLGTTAASSTQAATSVQPAAQIFANAIRAAALDLPDDAPAPVPLALTGSAPEVARTVQAMSGAGQTPLDMRREDWPGTMIERIAALRDSAETSDTRMRLSPDNLGTIDVSIRREGDRLHVHFAAEAQATRQMLADAAPRLAELADARGIKLGQTSVDSGSGGAQQQQTPHYRESEPSLRPNGAISAFEAGEDERIA